MTQIQKVKARIREVGYVDNFWAIDNYILRLGAIVHTLKHRDGMHFTGAFGRELGKDRRLWKNFYYVHSPVGYSSTLVATREVIPAKEPPAINKQSELVPLSEKDQLPLW